MSEFAYVSGEQSDFVALSRTKQGKLYRKHILSAGELLYPKAPGGKINIDTAFLNKMKENFEKKYCPIVQIPLAGSNNEHTEDPSRNIGEIVDVQVENDKMYAYFDIRDKAQEDKPGKTLLGASALFDLNYTDTKTLSKVGPTLLHVAMTNRPYVTDLEDFEDVVSLSAEGIDNAVLLTASNAKENTIMDLDELLATLRNDHNIDVSSLQKRDSEFTALSNSLVSALKDGSSTVALSNTENPSSTELVDAVVALSTSNVELNTQVVELSSKYDGLVADAAKSAAESKVDELVASGRVLPKQRDAMVKLSLTDAELFENLVPEKAIVSLSNELGTEPIDEAPEAAAVAEAEIARITSSPAASSYVRS